MPDYHFSEGATHASPALDREHDILVKALAGLHNAVLEGRGPQVITPLLRLLAQFCAEHFANEEAVMRACEYPGVEAHAAAHEGMLRTVMELQRRSAEEVVPTIVDTMDLLKLLTLHTERFDAEAHRAIQAATQPPPEPVPNRERPLLMAWQERYQLGIMPIDIQHRVLVDLTNKLHKAAMGSGGNIRDAIEELVQYATFHFAFEERMMVQSAYPAFEEHRAGHDALLNQLKAIQRDILAEQLKLDARVMNFLQGWLTNHIVSSDRHFVPFVRAGQHEPSHPPVAFRPIP